MAYSRLLALIFFMTWSAQALALPSCFQIGQSSYRREARNAQNLKDIEKLIASMKSAELQQEEWIAILKNLKILPSFVDAAEYAVALYRASEYMNLNYPLTIERNVIVQLEKVMKAALSAHPEKAKEVASYNLLPRSSRYQIIDGARVKIARPSDRELTPMEQNHIWETEFNSQPETRTSLAIPFEIKRVHRNEVVVDASDSLPSWLKQEFFPSPDAVYFYQNPMNTDPQVPFVNRPTEVERPGELTAARTAYFRAGSRYYAVKTPTNYTNPNLPTAEKKADMRKSVIVSMNRSRHVDMIDRRIGRDARLIILKEVLAVYDAVSGNGFTVRDISPLMDGRYHLPSSAFLSPLGGEKIVKTKNAGANYARLQGMAQALLLLRYGLVMKFPHGQNTLMPLDLLFQFTESVEIREMSDTALVEDLARIISPDSLALDREQNFEIRSLSWALTPNDQPLDAFGNRHYYQFFEDLRKGFVQTIQQELGISIEAKFSVSDFLKAYHSYHERLGREHRGIK